MESKLKASNVTNRLLKINPSNNYFLLGPRGTGKSRFLTKNFPQALIINLLEKKLYFDLTKDPDRLVNIIGKNHQHMKMFGERL